VIGFAAGGIPALPLNLALLKGASIVGVFWGEFAKREPASNAKALMELAGWYAQGKIKPVIEHRIEMRELPKAFELMAARQVRGKLVLVNRAAS
jgi:NADPH:quinone reductase